MKERPIIMSADSVRAILDGRKTQTRRVVKFPVWVSEDDKLKLFIQKPPTGLALYENGRPVKRMTCPYGQVGDRLWVRETFTHAGRDYEYFADATEKDQLPGGWWYKRPKTPSIFMPRWASRITLEITGIRVERLQDINTEDIYNEGIIKSIPDTLEGATLARFGAISLWDKLNLKRGFGWDSNPWVWVISFKVVK